MICSPNFANLVEDRPRLDCEHIRNKPDNLKQTGDILNPMLFMYTEHKGIRERLRIKIKNVPSTRNYVCLSTRDA